MIFLTPKSRRIGILATVGASLVIGRGIAKAWQVPDAKAAGSVPPSADPLVALNRQFHDAYRRARIQKLAETGPVVLVGFQSLALVRGKSRVEVPFPPAIYERLKEVAHVPLLSFVMLEGTGGQPLDDVRRAEVGYVRELIESALAKLESDGFPPALVDRQRTILESCRSYLAGVLKDGKAPKQALDDFAGKTGPLMLANADDAAAAHLHTLNDQMDAWRKEMSPEEWRSMHVVVMSAHMARDREIAMQYFRRLLDEPNEGRRLIFAEGLFDESKALDLLGTHLLDGSASVAFFGDPMRLHRDLLADGATKALESMTIRP
jgi:hypothetical protein